MRGKLRRKRPEIVLRNGKPAAVILDIEEYQELLERLEDIEDLEMLNKMRSKQLHFREIDEFLKEFEKDI